jgi:hypothetical protein
MVEENGAQSNDERGRRAENDAGESQKDVVEEAIGIAKQAGETAREQAVQWSRSLLLEQKDRAAVEVERLAKAFKVTGEHLVAEDQKAVAAYAYEIARQLYRGARYIHTSDPQEIADDIGELARRQPSVFLGGAFAVGFILARFLRSSSPDREKQED